MGIWSTSSRSVTMMSTSAVICGRSSSDALVSSTSTSKERMLSRIVAVGAILCTSPSYVRSRKALTLISARTPRLTLRISISFTYVLATSFERSDIFITGPPPPHSDRPDCTACPTSITEAVTVPGRGARFRVHPSSCRRRLKSAPERSIYFCAVAMAISPRRF